MDDPPPAHVTIRPRRALLLAGHRIDAPDRPLPRFTPAMEAAAVEAAAALVGTLACDGRDLALTQGAAGADLILAEAMLSAGVTLQLLLPTPEDEFVARSVVSSLDGARWHRRYLAVRAASLGAEPQVLPATTTAEDTFERANHWLCATARASGARELHLICIWNGQPDEGPGGTAHLVTEVRRLGGRVHWIDSRTLA